MEPNRQHVRSWMAAGALVPALLMFIGFSAASVSADTSPLGALRVAAVSPASDASSGGGQQGGAQKANVVRWDLSIAISLSIGLSCLGAGLAVGRVGAAAIGASTERPEMLARSLIFVALAEGIAIYGLLVAILLYRLY
jgi:V/A-type H+-transporting ATPase subunit K